jgi:ParB family chromosome partitioning protein
MAKQKGLGRGLGAIFGNETIDIKVKPMAEMAEIKVADCTPNPTQPRRHFDETALEELADSIRTLGLIQPITVRKDGDKYLIISGERRWRAAQLAGVDTVPAYIRDVDDENLHAMALVENIQRQDLNAIEIALGLQRLIDECGLTQDALAEKVGKRRSTIANYMRLLRLADPVQLAVKEGVISMGHAKAIASVELPKQQTAVLKKIIKANLSVRQTEDYVRTILEGKNRTATAVVDEEYPECYTRLVEYLEIFFSQNISIKRTKSGGGKITIGFDNDSDIDRFIERFSKK